MHKFMNKTHGVSNELCFRHRTDMCSCLSRPQLIGLSTGDVEVHTLSQKFSALIPDEPRQFELLLDTSL